jgi:RHS repeat-associated protein
LTLPGGTSYAYGYDAAGRRVSQTVGGTTTNYVWDEQSTNGDIVAETSATGALQASYAVANGKVLAETQSGVTSYTLPDAQGSIRALTNASGAITDSYRYDAFGNLLSHQGSTSSAYGYDGQRLDAASGLYQLRARSYDPTTGRFISVDPSSANTNDPNQVDRYLYGAANPITFSDPSGLTLTEYGALVQAVSINTQNVLHVTGKAEQQLLGLAVAADLAVQARDLEAKAQVLYAADHDGQVFVPRQTGETGVGLAEFEDVNGNVRTIAALNNVGFGTPQNLAQWEASYTAYYEDLRTVLKEADIEVIADTGVISSEPRGQAVHEEIQLFNWLKANSGEIAPETTAVIGVPQNTICGTCAVGFGENPGRYETLPENLDEPIWVDEANQIDVVVAAFGAVDPPIPLE